MRQKSNSIAGFIGRFVFGYITTTPVILLICGTLFYRQFEAVAVLPVLAIGWAIVVAVAMLTARRAWLAVLLGATLFLIGGHILTGALLQERLTKLSSINYGSDDDYYIRMTQVMRPGIRAEPLNLSTHWNNVREQDRYVIAVSLRGYPFAMAYLFAWLPDDTNLHYIAAVCINIILLCLLYLAACQVVNRICGPVDPLLLLLVFAPVCLNLFMEASQCRKDVILNLIVFTACACIAPRVASDGKIRVWPIITLILLSLALLTIRPVYIILPLVMLGAMHIGRLKKLPAAYLLLSICMALAVFWFFYTSDFTLREIDLLAGRYGQNQIVLTSGGITSRIYALPLIGPFLYYLFLPFPRFDANIFSIEAGVTNVTFIAVVATVTYIFCNFKIIWRNAVLRSMVILVVVFIFMTDVGATLLEDPDPRYKAALLPFLCVLAFCTSMLSYRHRSGQRRAKTCAALPE